MKKEIINVDTNKKNKNKKEKFSRSSSYSKPTIKFIFDSKEELTFDKNIFLSIKIILQNNNNLKIQTLNNNCIQIDIPNSVEKEDISLFLEIIKYFLESDNNKTNNEQKIDESKIMKIFSISDLFISEYFNTRFIKDILLKYNYNNIAIELIYYSYKKLCYYSDKKEEVNNSYFDLFYQSLENISKNEQIVFNNLDKIKILDKKIIDEIIEKTFKNLIYGNTILIEENEEYDKIKSELGNTDDLHMIKLTQFNKLIQFLMELNHKQNNFFELITSEYAFLLSKESILELKNLPHPSLQVDIHFSDYSFYCQEFPLEIILNHKKIILIVSYKTEDHSFNINIKLLNHRINNKKNVNNILEIDKISEDKFIEDNSCFKIFTFLTHVMITKGPEKVTIATQNNLLSLSDSKTVYNILKISNFDNELRNFLIREPEKEYFSVIVQIKLCYKYSALASYLLRQFHLYYNDPNICKISKQLLILILENKFLKINKSNDIVTSILLWLEDEMNIKEDISNIFEMIEWENVDEILIIELIIKYSHVISGNKMIETMFINAFEKKYNNSTAVGNILKSLFSAGKKIDYIKLFTEMKKSQKNNKVYKYFNSEYKFKNNFFEYDNENENSSISKDSISFKEGIQQILNGSNKKENKKVKNYTFNNSINNIEEENLNNNDNENDKKIKNQKKEKENLNEKSKKIFDQNKNKDNSIKTKDKIIEKSESTFQKFKEINRQAKNKNLFNKITKNLSFLNKKQQNQVKSNNDKKIVKVEESKKINNSYIKNMKKVLKDKHNINNVSININNINNINISNHNISNHNISNYKNTNNQSLNKYNNHINTNSFYLTFYSNKNQKSSKHKNDYIKKTSFKLYATNNPDKNNTLNYINKTNNSESTFDNLLCSILKYDKTFHKSKPKFEKNIKIKKISTKNSTKKILSKKQNK